MVTLVSTCLQFDDHFTHNIVRKQMKLPEECTFTVGKVRKDGGKVGSRTALPEVCACVLRVCVSLVPTIDPAYAVALRRRWLHKSCQWGRRSKNFRLVCTRPSPYAHVQCAHVLIRLHPVPNTLQGLATRLTQCWTDVVTKKHPELIDYGAMRAAHPL